MDSVASLLGVSHHGDGAVEVEDGGLSIKWNDAMYQQVQLALMKISPDSIHRREGSTMKSVVSRLLEISQASQDINGQIQCMDCCLYFLAYPSANAFGITPVSLFHELSQVLRRIVQCQVNIYEGRPGNAASLVSADDENDDDGNTRTEDILGTHNTGSTSDFKWLHELLNHLLQMVER